MPSRKDRLSDPKTPQETMFENGDLHPNLAQTLGFFSPVIHEHKLPKLNDLYKKGDLHPNKINALRELGHVVTETSIKPTTPKTK